MTNIQLADDEFVIKINLDHNDCRTFGKEKFPKISIDFISPARSDLLNVLEYAMCREIANKIIGNGAINMRSDEQACKQKLRIETSKGLLTIEQLWDLPLTDLDKMAVSLERKKNAGQTKTFLNVETEADETAKLKFDIVLDVLKTKMDEEAAYKKSIENREHNQKVYAAIARKKDGQLESMTIEQLEEQIIR